jgi:hypothetical protein
VKKLARERAKGITPRISQLKDFKNHFRQKKEDGKGTMVFICRDQSAAGSITSAASACARPPEHRARGYSCSIPPGRAMGEVAAHES